MTQPPNLPLSWEHQEVGNTVSCGGCAFRFGAEHPNGDDTWTCPNCGDGNHVGVTNDALTAAAPDMLAVLCKLVDPDDFDQHPEDYGEDWHRARAIISRAQGFA